MDKSLDDIIKSKKIKLPLQIIKGQVNKKSQMNKSKNLSRKPFVPQTYNRIPPKGKLVDARQKIIAQTRATVIDARSKITQKDARLKLLNNKSSRVSKPRDLRGKLNLRTQPLPVLKPVGIIQRTVRGDDNYLAPAPARLTVPIQRTIRNNFNARYESSVRQPIISHLDMEWADLDSPVHVDPVVRPDPYLTYHTTNDLYHNPMDIISTRTVRNDLMRDSSPPSPHALLSSRLESSRGILGGSSRSGSSAGILGGSRSRSSEGILAASRHSSSQQQSQQGHRIVVSNLKDSVNSADIKELFEDIGPLIASRVVRPGTAEVIYASQKDAIKAVETYHNRQLDKQPMKCMLVTPRASANPLVPAAPKLPTATRANTVQPDLAAVYKALFNKQTQVYK